MHFIVCKHPKYSHGGYEDLDKGIDCSGYLYLAAKWAGIPGIRRTTANRMALGLDGWTGKEIDFSQVDDCDLLFWTFKEARPNGHVGAFLRDQDGRGKATHSSVRRGVVLEDLAELLRTNLTRIRRLDTGD